MDNRDLIERVVLCHLIHNPSLLLSEEYPLKSQDFSKKVHRQIYSAALNLYAKGTQILQPEEIILQIGKTSGLSQEFRENRGEGILIEIGNMNPEAYSYDNAYGSFKKYALFQDLRDNGVDITDLYNPMVEPEKAKIMSDKIDLMSYKDIIDHYREKIAKIEDKYENFIEKSGIEAGEGLEELMRSLEEQPEVGVPLNGDILNTICRGARTKKVYLNSAGTSAGKSRMAAGNVAKLGFPLYYDEEKETWIKTGMQYPVLFITTELEHQEVQTMLLAYVSGVNEEKILNGKYDTKDERERVIRAKEIIENCHNVFIEFIPEPSIDSVAAKIRLYALQKNIEYVFYDYVHVSGATYKEKKDMRDDVWLMLFVDKLKQLANELDIHISTATQLNASSYEDREVKNEAMIRGMRRKCPNTIFPVITGMHI